MSNTLTKNTIVTVISPGTPGTPPTPYVPAYDEVVDYDTVGILYWQVTWSDGSGEHLSLVPPDSMPPSDATIISEVPVYGPVHVHEVIHHDAVPATPGTPGTPPVVDINYQLGWNAGALSIGAFSGDEQFQFSIDASSVGVVCGLNDANVGAGYEEIDYGIYAETGLYRIIENGVIRTTHATFATSDVFTIRRLGGEVVYFQGSTLVYTSTIRSTAALFADCSLYSGGDNIINASISAVGAAFAATSGSLAADLGSMDLKSSDSAGYFDLYADIGDIGASMQTWDIGTLSADLGGVAIKMREGSASVLECDIGDIVVEMESGFIEPVSLILSADFGWYGVFGTALPGQIGALTADLGPVDVKASDYAYSDLTADTGAIGALMMDQLASFGHILSSLPRMTFSGSAQVWPDYYNQGLRVTLPSMTAQLSGYDTLVSTLPSMTVAFEATNAGYNALSSTLPSLTAAMTGSVGTVGELTATLPRMRAAGLSGARINATLPSLTAAASATVGRVGELVATLPSLTIVATGFVGGVGELVATLPRMAMFSGNLLRATLPSLRMLIAANDISYVVTDAYAVTLNVASAERPVRPVSRYTNYPLHSIVRLGDNYLGFGPAGAFLMSGDDDAGTPIQWNVLFGPSVDMPGRSFGEGTAKRNEGVYFQGRFNGAVSFSVKVDDGQTYTYTQQAPKTTLDTLRFTPARGLTGFAWQFGLSGVGPMNLYRAEFLQRTVQRKVRHG